MVLSAEAPAKINRELRVGPRRSDGFHEIRSRFCTIDFSDRIEVEESDRLELSCSGIPVPCDETNLVARAARALADRIGTAPGVRIRLEKRVPAGAGQRPEGGPSEIGFGVCRRQSPIRFFPQQLREQIARGIH